MSTEEKDKFIITLCEFMIKNFELATELKKIVDELQKKYING